mmetsp:Transcript_21829/g.52147  ORF Transcript_21829/g.52147 Transcript_21829/m.52147 type:complete len:285 (+) Transcript_21829:241-1095(+)
MRMMEPPLVPSEKRERTCWLKFASEPAPVSITESSLCLSDSLKHVAWFASKRSRGFDFIFVGRGVLPVPSLKAWTRIFVPPILRKVNSSIAHQRRDEYVGPLSTTISVQPARKTGSAVSAASMLFWSTHALSSHTSGSFPLFFRRYSSPHSCSASYLASPGSLHEWVMKAATSPKRTFSVFAARPVSALESRSSFLIWHSGIALKFSFASRNAVPASVPAMSAATVAACCASCCSCWREPRLPSELMQLSARPRLRGVQKRELKSQEGPMKKRIAMSGWARTGA